MNLGTTTFPPIVDNTVIVGFLLFAFLGFALRWIRSGEKSWTNANSAIKPNLNAGDAPIIQTRRGVIGCVQAAVLRFLVFPVVFFIALDFILRQGQTVMAILDQLR